MTSTKEKIKQVALALFAKKGFAGTSMSELAKIVGIRKASIYSHYKGKEELFLSVFDDVARDYEDLNERLIKDSQGMEIHDRLHYIFKNYIVHYSRNRELQCFWQQINYFTPSEVHAEYFRRVVVVDERVRLRLEAIIKDGMDQGLLAQKEPIEALMSFRAMCEGVIYWVMVANAFEEEMIDAVWRTLWGGLQRR